MGGNNEHILQNGKNVYAIRFNAENIVFIKFLSASYFLTVIQRNRQSNTNKVEIYTCPFRKSGSSGIERRPTFCVSSIFLLFFFFSASTSSWFLAEPKFANLKVLMCVVCISSQVIVDVWVYLCCFANYDLEMLLNRYNTAGWWRRLSIASKCPCFSNNYCILVQ